MDKNDILPQITHLKKNQSLEIEEDIKTQIINFIPTDFESSYQNLRKKFKKQKIEYSNNDDGFLLIEDSSSSYDSFFFRIIM